ERRLAGAVRPHDGGDLAVLHGEVQAADDLGAVFGDAGVEISDFKHSFRLSFPSFRGRAAEPGIQCAGPDQVIQNFTAPDALSFSFGVTLWIPGSAARPRNDGAL